MNLLLDTHVVLWAARGERRVPPAARLLMEDPGNDLLFSIVVIWEVAIKHALRRPGFDFEPGSLRDGLLDAGYAELLVRAPHCQELGRMPAVHGDPFDRMMVAQARAEGLTFVTVDKVLAGYGPPVLVV